MLMLKNLDVDVYSMCMWMLKEVDMDVYVDVHVFVHVDVERCGC